MVAFAFNVAAWGCSNGCKRLKHFVGVTSNCYRSSLTFEPKSTPSRRICVSAVSLSSSIENMSKPDAITMGRASLIRKLCDTCLSHHDFIADRTDSAAKQWPKQFNGACHALEHYMLLHHHRIAKHLMQKFARIDPDRKERCLNISEGSSDEQEGEDKDPAYVLEEKSFMTQFAYVLRKAGYCELPQEIVKASLKRRGIYGNIQLNVKQDNYSFIRFWVYGKKEKKRKVTKEKGKNKDDVVLHERVIVAAKSNSKRNMILKGFKDIAVGHYETLLPDAKVLVPRKRRWSLNIVLATSFVVTFFDVIMFLMTDLKFHSAGLMLCFAAFVVRKTLVLYDSQRQKYMLEWKNWLYYRSTANNAGLVMDSINRLHQRMVKQALIVYAVSLILTKSGDLVSEEEITKAAIQWIASANGTEIEDVDFCSSSAVSLLEKVGIIIQEKHYCRESGFRFKVKSPLAATKELLDKIERTAIE